MQRLDVDIVANDRAFRLTRVRASREPLLGAMIRASTRKQSRVIESGAAVIITACEGKLYGPGHRIEITPGEHFLYLPLDVVEWVLHVDPESSGETPDIEHRPPRAEPVEIPLVEPVQEGLYPDSMTPWLRIPSDVGTWASCLDIRSTSLAQRCKRLAGSTPKTILSALRATVAFELADHYRGEGTSLALDLGYSSQAHLSNDVSKRFGIPLTRLLSDEVNSELEWLNLLASSLR